MNLGLFLIIMSFKAGFIPNGHVYYGISEGKQHLFDLSNAYYAEFSAEIVIVKFLFIRGSINNLFHGQTNDLNFSPDHDEYIFSAGISLDWFELAYKRKCYHPIFMYQSYDLNLKSLLEGSTDEIYIRARIQLKI